MASALPSKSGAPSGAANGHATTVAKKESGSTNAFIRIRVITVDNTNEVHFRLKEEVPFIRMKLAYAQKLGHNADELRYVFDGHRITNYDTPKSLGMVNDDVVEIYQEKIGGGM